MGRISLSLREIHIVLPAASRKVKLGDGRLVQIAHGVNVRARRRTVGSTRAHELGVVAPARSKAKTEPTLGCEGDRGIAIELTQ